MLVSCGGGEFSTVGKKYDPGKYTIYTGTEQSFAFKGEAEKYGYALDGKIALPPIFDMMELPKTAEDGTTYFVVNKGGKHGVVKAFEKGYYVPCEYDHVNIFLDGNILVLEKKGEKHQTLRLSNLEKITPTKEN